MNYDNYCWYETNIQHLIWGDSSELNYSSNEGSVPSGIQEKKPK